MKRNPIKEVAIASLMVAMGIVLPFLTASNPQLGSIFLLMHIPVLIAGLVLGPKYGLIVGMMTPILRSLLFTLPPLYPQALIMMFELGAYGFFIGLAYHHLPKRTIDVYASLFIALLLGRAVWGIAASIFYPLAGFNFSFQIFLKTAFVTSLPGLGIQIVLIPLVFIYLKRTRVLD